VQGLGEARRSPDAIQLDTSRQIIDGRNRFRACTLAGVTPTFVEKTLDDRVAYTLSCNLHRRHLTKALSIAALGVYGLLTFVWHLTGMSR